MGRATPTVGGGMPFAGYEDHDDCVADNQDKDDPDAYCAELERQTEGEASAQTLQTGFSGAVVTALPTPEDAQRLAVDGGDPPEALHVTLAWLGNEAEGPQPVESYDDAEAAAREVAGGFEAVDADAFGTAELNPASDEPATVLLLESTGLVELHDAVDRLVTDQSDHPVWLPHLTLGYDLDADVTDRLGTVTFDRLAVSYGETVTEVPLGQPTEEPEEESMPASARRVAVKVPDAYRQTYQGDEPTVEAPETDAPVGPAESWEGVIVVEGVATGDGRLMEPGALRWDDPPIPLRWAKTDEGEHMGAVVVGRISEIWRDGREIRARGDFDLRSEAGAEAARLVAEGIVTGVSVDLDDVDLEVRVAQEVLDEMDAEMEAIFDENAEPPERGEADDEGRVTVAEIGADDEMLVTTDGRIRAATLVDIPAFTEATVRAVDGQEIVTQAMRAWDGQTFQGFPPSCPPPWAGRTECIDEMEGAEGIDDAAAFCQAWFAECGELSADTIVASAEPEAPPAAWFDDPALDGPTPLTITDEGRVYGHLACWGACHTAFSDECVTPPSSQADYSYFRTGAVRTAEGTEVSVGRVTADTLHAGRRASAVDTLAHYENTGLAVADVAAGEDAHGIWVAGALRPGVTDEQVRALRASPLSGDWRRIGGNLELVAALAVNSPGFPVPRAMVASGNVTALQSAGTVSPPMPDAGELSDEDYEMLRRMARREREAEQQRRDQATKARRKVLAASAASRVRGGTR